MANHRQVEPMPAKQGAGGLDVAVVGAGTLMGEELRGILAECNFPIGEAVMMGEGDQVGKLMEFNGEACLITELDAKRLERMDLLFVCDRGPGARRAVSAARRGNGFVIDLVDAEAGLLRDLAAAIAGSIRELP